MKIILVGGGHSHAVLLRHWGQQPSPGLELTLISNVLQAPYSGMVPGHLAGFYRYPQIHIDLVALADFAQAHLLQDEVIALEARSQKLQTRHHGWLEFDVLCLDIGSTPSLDACEGSEWVVPAKPIAPLLIAWQDFLRQTRSDALPTVSLAVVGGGASGVELALNLQARLQYLLGQRTAPPTIQTHLIQRGPALLPTYAPRARRQVMALLERRGIQLHCEQAITRIDKDLSHGFPAAPLNTFELTSPTGLRLRANWVLWVTQACPPRWLQSSGLALDDRGFVLVSANLQSLSHPFIFASGDIASCRPHLCPKAGVFAVRQGRPLGENVRRYCLGQPLRPYIPPKRYLSLLSTGQETAIACWGPWAWHSALAWRWKDWLDRRFMSQFTQYH